MKINPISTPIARGFKCYHLASQRKIIISMFSYNSSLRWYMARMNKFPLLVPNQRLNLYSGKNQQQLCETKTQIVVFRRVIYIVLSIFILFCLYYCSCFYCRAFKAKLLFFPHCVFSLLFCLFSLHLYSALYSSSLSWLILLSYNAHLLLPHLHHSFFLSLSFICHFHVTGIVPA